MKKILALILALSIVLGLCACGKKASEPKTPAEPMTFKTPITDGGVDGNFALSYENFSANLLRLSFETDKGNILVSPLSVMLALALAANGAQGETQTQMTGLFGTDDLDKFNKDVFDYVNTMSTEDHAKLKIANSAWFFKPVSKSYVGDITKLYDAQIYADLPKNKKTVKQINEWVKEHTDGMIERLFEDDYTISEDAFSMLINAVAFDAEWLDPYMEYAVEKEDFTNVSGEKKTADMMNSTENTYIKLENAVGFEKEYYGGYTFVALLPNEDIDFADFVASLDGKTLNAVNASKKEAAVYASLPKFEYDYETNLKDILVALSMTDAFDDIKADFSKMKEGVASDGNTCIDEVLHKTHIGVTESGTKAAAVTDVMMRDMCCVDGPGLERYTVKLDRPFVYMITHESSSLPLFIGTVTNIGE